MVYEIEQTNSERKCIFAYKVYTIALFLLLESILQWQLFIFTDLTDKLPGNNEVCFLILVTTSVIITLNRFVDVIKYLMSCFVYTVFILVMVELTIVGAGCFIAKARGLDYTVSILILAFVMFIFSYVGCYMIAANTIVFVACLCLWMFVCILGVLLLLTILLLIDFEITYINVLSIIIYLSVLFNISYDARLINSTSDVMSFKDCLSSALTIYGEFILLLLTTLELTKQKSEFW